MASSSIIVFVALFSLSHAADHPNVGTAACYSPPYIPSACYGNDPRKLPSRGLFGAAGEGLWDNGAACGRQYLVRCISVSAPKVCKSSRTIKIKIIDHAQTLVSRPSASNATIVLSATAYGLIADAYIASVNIQFQQV